MGPSGQRTGTLCLVPSGALIFASHEACLRHDPGGGHPEQAGRLGAVVAGLAGARAAEAVVRVTPRAATREELLRVHTAEHLDALEGFCRTGGGPIDDDTAAGPGSWDAALVAAGAGPDLVARLRSGEADTAFVAVRPPGHHATPRRSMGFCLLNNVAVTAASLASEGERVLIVDIDAHHGNGTQDVFYRDPRVAYLSLHEWPLYPGTGWLDQRGAGEGEGTTVNIPLPSGATGDVYLRAVEQVVEPLAGRFRPTWLLVSAGFDAHRADPLTGLSLSAGDFAVLVAELVPLVPPGRVIALLEGGYDLAALESSTAATVDALLGVRHFPEPPTTGGPGVEMVSAARRSGSP